MRLGGGAAENPNLPRGAAGAGGIRICCWVGERLRSPICPEEQREQGEQGD